MLKIFLSILIFTFSSFNVFSQWQFSNGPTGGSIFSLTKLGTNIYAGTARGVYYSTNDGLNWSKISINLYEAVGAIISQNNYMCAGTWGKGVYFSSDNGVNWAQSSLNSSKFNAIISGSNNTIFAGCNYTVKGPISGMYASINNGVNWSLRGLINYRIYSLALSDNKILAGTEDSGIYISSNNGYNWIKSNFNNVMRVSCITVNGNYIFAGATNGLYVSTDGGMNWTLSPLSNKDVLSIETSNNIVLAGVNYGGAYLSTDYGLSWTQIFVNDYCVNAIKITGNKILAGTSFLGMFISLNNGSNWTKTDLSAWDVYGLTANNENIYAGIWAGGVYNSSNNGTEWLPIGMNTQYPTGSSYIQCITSLNNNIVIGTNATGILKTTNNGLNWIQTTLTSQCVLALLTNGDTIYAGCKNWHDDGGIYKSTDGGLSWGITSFNHNDALSILINGNKMFVGTGYYGVYYSSNNGINWVKTPFPVEQHTVYTLALKGNNIYAGTGRSIYLSTNDGNNWSKILSTNQAVNSIVVYNNAVIAGTEGDGIYVSKSNDTVWTQKNEGLNTLKIKTLCIKDDYIFAGTLGTSVWRRWLPDIISVRSISINIPDKYYLFRNYPNPFNSTTIIKYQIQKSNYVEVKVYDILGKDISTLVNEKQSPGTYEVQFNGSSLPSGIYFYRLLAGDYIQIQKMLLLK